MKYQEYLTARPGEQNVELQNLACWVVNRSPEPSYQIRLRNEILAVAEQERMGFDFNRALRASLGARWADAKRATIDFLTDIKNLNEHLQETRNKYETQMGGLIESRTANFFMTSRSEQLAGLICRQNAYCSLMELKLHYYERYKNFLQECCDMMGYTVPGDLLNRHETLKSVFSELMAEHETRVESLAVMTEELNQIRAEANLKHMKMHKKIFFMQDRLQTVEKESRELEEFIESSIIFARCHGLELYTIRNSIFNIYELLTRYRGEEMTKFNPFAQLDEIAMRLQSTSAIIEDLSRSRQCRKGKKPSGIFGFTPTPGEAVWSEEFTEDDETSYLTLSSPPNYASAGPWLDGNRNWQHEMMPINASFDLGSGSESESARSDSLSSKPLSLSLKPNIGANSTVLPLIKQSSFVKRVGERCLRTRRGSFGSFTWSREAIAAKPRKAKSVNLSRSSAFEYNVESLPKERTTIYVQKIPQHSSFVRLPSISTAELKRTRKGSSIFSDITFFDSQSDSKESTQNLVQVAPNETRIPVTRGNDTQARRMNPHKLPVLKRTPNVLEKDELKLIPDAVSCSGHDLKSDRTESVRPAGHVRLNSKKMQPGNSVHENGQARSERTINHTRPTRFNGLSPLDHSNPEMTAAKEEYAKQSLTRNGSMKDETKKMKRCNSTMRKYIRENCLNILANVRLRHSPPPE